MPDASYDAVVIGSGFGGSVVAHALAERGVRVLVLERGRRYGVGEFPRRPAESFWDPDEGRYGLLDVWSFGNRWALVSSGLGGGSLIYANVLLRMPASWFADRGDGVAWPITGAELEEHYAAVESMLGATPYPPEYRDSTPKTAAFVEAARQTGHPVEYPKLAVTFAPPGGAPVPDVPLPGSGAGVPRRTCRLCGECDIGCNSGAKNTLDLTYLAALGEGDVRTLCDVKRIEPENGGYRVSWIEHDPERGAIGRGSALAPKLVLSAGVFGTALLLFRNRAHLGELPASLGRRFSGNGDDLAFAAGRAFDPVTGPVITASLAVPDALDGGSGPGLYVQDGAYPGLFSAFARGVSVPWMAYRGLPVAARIARGFLRGRPDTNLSGEAAAWFERSNLGWSLMLGMGRDAAAGTLRLTRDGRLDLDLPLAPDEPYYRRLRAYFARVAEAMGGRYVERPFAWLMRRVATHPLGGCAMGDVVSPITGRLLSENGRLSGIHVADGSVLPGPAGANPSLTIAAVARRFALGMVDEWR